MLKGLAKESRDFNRSRADICANVRGVYNVTLKWFGPAVNSMGRKPIEFNLQPRFEQP